MKTSINMTSAKLFMMGEERELLGTYMDYYKRTDAKGAPASNLEGGFLKLSFVSQESDAIFWHHLTKVVDDETERMEKGEIHFYSKGEEDLTIRKYKFRDAFIVAYSEEFNTDNTENMVTFLTISPAIQNYGFTHDFVKYWQVSWLPPAEPNYYQSQKEPEDRMININGHFYNKDGTFEGKINESDFEGNVEDVYVCDGKSTRKDRGDSVIFNNIQSLKIKNDVFLRIAGLAYSESGFAIDIIKGIPFIVMNHHKQLTNSKVSKYKNNWLINNTLIKMRNKWDDFTYAHAFHFEAQGNPAFRNFLNIKLNENIDFDKNAEGRNNDIKMKLSIEYTILAIKYLNNNYVSEDNSNGGIGWQSADICTNSNWKKWLFIHSEHKKYAFKNWLNSSTLENSIFESISVFKGDFGTTLIYKSTTYSFKNSATGNL